MPKRVQPLKIMILGLRGIPDVQGGVETHAQQLYPRLVKMGFDVEAIVRSPFIDKSVRSFEGVKITRLWTTTRPGLEALIHSVLGVLYAAVKRPDVLHIHAVGPAIVTPLARLLGLRVVVTHHGPDYDRDKWGIFARMVLRAGEFFGMRFANQRIAISTVIADLVRAKHGVECIRIPNGVPKVRRETNDEHVRRLGLTPGRYVLEVGRMVPEKRQLDLIEAFKLAKLPGWKLALVGGLSDDDYSKSVRHAARDCDVVLTGFLSGIPLAQVYSHAGIFVLPSSHEGLPIAMLEALSYGVRTIASDIPANLEVGLASSDYFTLGDTGALASYLISIAAETPARDAEETRAQWVEKKYDWDSVASATAHVVTIAVRP
jgi:glycosyltransferase involved in cell wall biosynthesis